MKKTLILLVLGVLLVFNNSNCSFAQNEIKEQIETVNSNEYVVKAGTRFNTSLRTEISSEKTKPGDEMEFDLISNFAMGEKIILLQRSTFKGVLQEFSKKSLFSNAYNVIVDIKSLEEPFGKEYVISAHPEFDIKEEKKKKSRRFKFGLNRNASDDLANNGDAEQPEDSSGTPFVLSVGTQVPVVIDKDFIIYLKK